MAISEVYIDESYDGQEPPLLCLAGYIYRKSKAREFGRGWSAYLKRRGLPYFHMSECAHAEGIFKGRDDCDEVARELIRRTTEDTAFGFTVAVNERDYEELIGPQEGMRSAYSFALMVCMHHVRRWRERAGVTGPTSFFFEAGHQHQRDANDWLTWMLGNKKLSDALGYTGHAFVPKATPQLHPADTLAWHWRLETKRRHQPNRRKPRADFLALARPVDVLSEYSRAQLEEIAREMKIREAERARAIREALESGIIPSV